jgi:hypothetical protein
MSLEVGKLAFLLFYAVDQSLKLFLGTNLIIFFWWLCRLAYEAQDEAHYRRHYEKTGDDFEGRYTNEKKNDELHYEEV